MAQMAQDPTRDEMLTFLQSTPFAAEFDEFDREEAVYWFADHWHSGQWSNLYSALCTSPYSPGLTRTGPEETAQMLYDALEQEYAR